MWCLGSSVQQSVSVSTLTCITFLFVGQYALDSELILSVLVHPILIHVVGLGDARPCGSARHTVPTALHHTGGALQLRRPAVTVTEDTLTVFKPGPAVNDRSTKIGTQEFGQKREKLIQLTRQHVRTR